MSACARIDPGNFFQVAGIDAAVVIAGGGLNVMLRLADAYTGIA